MLYSKCLAVIYFIYTGAYISVQIFQFVPPHLPPETLLFQTNTLVTRQHGQNKVTPDTVHRYTGVTEKKVNSDKQFFFSLESLMIMTEKTKC